MNRRTIRCLSTTFAVVAIVLGATAVVAQTHTTGFNMAKSCPNVVASGESFQCTVTISNRDDQHGVINFTLTNQVPFNNTVGCPGCGPIVPLECRQPFDPADCTAGTVVVALGVAGTPEAACGACIPETAPINCTADQIFFTDQVVATGTDAVLTNLPVSSSTTNATPVAPLVCQDNNACTTDTCDPATGCVFTPVNCSDNNACTNDACDPANGCTHSAISCDDSNACTTDACDPANGCTHSAISCDDSNACTTDACDATNGCTHSAISCDDSNACTTDACDATNGCTHSAISCDDNNACTVDACDATNGCTNTFDSTIPGCGNEEICRTPGFWGTHGGDTEKAGSQNITLDVLGSFGGSLVICGQPITNTDLGSPASALEAICVSPKGDSRLQLARQLTAAALNCGITNSVEGSCTTQNGAAPCAGVSIEAIFDACNAACPTGTTAQVDPDGAGGPLDPVTVSCIGLIDCFNNGGVISFNETSGEFECGVAEGTSCHDRELVNGCFDFVPPGPAGSPRECNDSRKNCVTIFGNLPNCP